MQLKTLLLTALAACLIPTLAQAQGQSTTSNQDGQRKGPPSQAARGQGFAKMDSNGDKQLSLEEVQGAGATRIAQHFDNIDSNGDGQLSKDELKAAQKRKADNDKKVGNDQRKGPPNQAARGQGFAKMDSNGDGQLSLEEVQSADAKRLTKHFDKIDSNGDGQLSKDELKAAGKKKGSKGSHTDTQAAE